MKYFLLLLSAIIALGSCTSKKADDLVMENIPVENQVNEFKGEVPSDYGLNEFLFDVEDQYSWQDLDAFYKEVILKDEGAHYSDNAKNEAFFALVYKYEFQKKAPKEVIAFYVNEQSALTFTPHEKEFIKCLESLVGHLSNEELAAIAQKRYNDTKDFYLNDSHWKPYWEKDKSRYDVYLEFANSLGVK